MNVYLKFVVPSDPRCLAMIRAAVGELSLAFGLSRKECRSVILAVDEALANVIRHAYHGASDGPIEIDCHGSEGRLEFTILDQGESPDAARLGAHPLDAVSLGGRGTHIIRTIMDEVRYERVPPRKPIEAEQVIADSRIRRRRPQEGHMNSSTRYRNGLTILDVTGHIDIGSSPALRKTMLACLKDGERLAVNLAGVKYIDSSGIASLLEVLKEARNTKKKFVLFGLTAAVREVLQLTRLTGVFEIYGNEDEVPACPESRV